MQPSRGGCDVDASKDGVLEVLRMGIGGEVEVGSVEIREGNGNEDGGGEDTSEVGVGCLGKGQ